MALPPSMCCLAGNRRKCRVGDDRLPVSAAEASRPWSCEEVAEVFRRARCAQEEVGKMAGAELVHSELPAEEWGVSQVGKII